ncbi:MAG: YegP family protein [Planctomycetota bacterium]|jgi:uncharacterized protein YegP (UPF0339 family)
MAGTFEITTTDDGQFMFNLKAANGEVILTSQAYSAKASAQDGIESVHTNASADERYDRLQSTDGKPYFVLKAANGLAIGTSQMYSSVSAMEHGIDSAKENGPTAAVTDLS